jgi:fumarate reductase flavoprotein subunit
VIKLEIFKDGSAKMENLQADIVVIGAGGAGLTAAVAAAEAGVKKINILEKAARPGGNTLSAGCIFAVNSPTQKRLGINISADDVFQEKMAHADWKTNPKLIRAYVDKSGDMIRWLEEKGMEFNDIMVFRPEADSPRVTHDIKPGHHGVTGRALIEMLSQNCEKWGVKLLCETAARKILTEKGEVSGVLATAKNRELSITTKSVVIAAGGFAKNREMLNRYFPSHGDVFSYSPPQMTGDGLTMAEEVGAITDDQLSMLLVGPEHEGSPRVGMLLQQPDMLMVNKKGERFFDESVHLHAIMDVTGNALSRQPGKVCYALLDSRTMQAVIQKGEPLRGMDKFVFGDESWTGGLESDFQKDADRGTARIASSWDEIAEWMGAVPGALRGTIDEYNSFCDRGYDEIFAKGRKYLMPLRTPPYYAISGRQVINTTFGGIMINHLTEVINKKYTPIGGLYAAGDNAGSWASATYSHRYPGSAFGFALFSGYTAGENAAKYVKGMK